MKKYLHFLHNARDETYLAQPFVQPVMAYCLSPAMGT